MPWAMVAVAMNVGLYQSAAALSSLERWQNVVSQNISSSQVTGFKKRMVQFDVKPMGEVAVANQSRIGEGQMAVFPRVNYSIDFQQGEVTPTGRDLDATIQGEGFFVLRGTDGTPSYTRNGEFHIRPDRTLVNVDGSEVLGIGDVPIQLQAEGGAIKINQDGSIFPSRSASLRLPVKSRATRWMITNLQGNFHSLAICGRFVARWRWYSRPTSGHGVLYSRLKVLAKPHWRKRLVS